MDTPFKLNELTEEQLSAVVNYFDTGDTGWINEKKIRFRYWVMKSKWTKIDKAEEQIQKLLKRKQDSYRWLKEQEINDHVKAYKQETAGDTWRYELMKLNEWEDGRTLIIWFMWNYDMDRQKQKWTHVVEIEERQNPDYFQEIIKRFNLVID